jgi:hypothetical protein
MNEKPIIFNSEMVKAILEGRKTQTRRALKKQPIDILPMKVPNMWVTLRIQDKQNSENNRGQIIGCRYGRVGDRLWVRETWAHDDMNCKDIKCGNRDHIWWKANEEKIVADSFAGDARWRPSIFMPRWASRITLEITNIRVERLHEITPADVLAEGIKRSGEDGYWLAPLANVPDYPWNDAPMAFASLWNSINSKRGYGWDVNPWVWVIEFKKMEQ